MEMGIVLVLPYQTAPIRDSFRSVLPIPLHASPIVHAAIVCWMAAINRFAFQNFVLSINFFVPSSRIHYSDTFGWKVNFIIYTYKFFLAKMYDYFIYDKISR